MRLLEALAAGEAIQSVSDLARNLGIDKSSASRLLKTLESSGAVEQDPLSRGYMLGSMLVHLGQTVLRRLDLRTVAQPFLENLVRDTGECAHLATLANGHALYVSQATPPRGVNVDAPVGTLAPLHCTALGKVLLAFQAENVISSMVADMHMEKFTRRTVTYREDLIKQLRQVREAGVAFDDEEFSIGVRCMAAPVFRHAGVVVGAIGISGPSPRVTDDRIHEWEPIVRDRALELSTKLGWRPAPGGPTGLNAHTK